MAVEFNEKAESEFQAILDRYPDDEMGRHAALLPVLTLAQREFGWMSVEVMDYIAERLSLPQDYVSSRYRVLPGEGDEAKLARAKYGMTPAKVLSTATFYTMFNKQPVGKCHIQVCTTLTCAVRHGYEILEILEDKLHINVGDTTPDGRFTLTEVECLASCGTAPMLQITWSDGEIDYVEDLSAAAMDEHIEAWSARCEELPDPRDMH